MRANKNFLSKPLELCFLLVCLGCYVKDVCLSCLLNNIVNQHNPCALVIMLLFLLLAIFQNHHLGKLSFFIQIILFIQISAKIYPWDKLLSKLSIYRIIWTYKVEWSNYFTNFYFVNIYERISNTFEKTLQRRCLCLHLFLKLSTQSLTPLFETLLYLTMAWSLSTGSIIVSDNARLATNDWPCVVSWFCVTAWLWWVTCV
jgi:hypothetical protein